MFSKLNCDIQIYKCINHNIEKSQENRIFVGIIHCLSEHFSFEIKKTFFVKSKENGNDFF